MQARAALGLRSRPLGHPARVSAAQPSATSYIAGLLAPSLPAQSVDQSSRRQKLCSSHLTLAASTHARHPGRQGICTTQALCLRSTGFEMHLCGESPAQLGAVLSSDALLHDPVLGPYAGAYACSIGCPQRCCLQVVRPLHIYLHRYYMPAAAGACHKMSCLCSTPAALRQNEPGQEHVISGSVRRWLVRHGT